MLTQNYSLFPQGLRVPFLKLGWNRQYLMMKEFGFVYDSSIVAPAFTNPPLWPYTLDYKIPHECVGNNNCPTRSYPGVWEMVMNQMEIDDVTCVYADQCPPSLNGDDIFHMFIHNFKRHYSSNRAPMGLYFHSSWFGRQDYVDAFSRFVDYVLKLPGERVGCSVNWKTISRSLLHFFRRLFRDEPTSRLMDEISNAQCRAERL